MYEACRLWGFLKLEEMWGLFMFLSRHGRIEMYNHKVLSPSQKIKVKIINIDKEEKEYHSFTKTLTT